MIFWRNCARRLQCFLISVLWAITGSQVSSATMSVYDGGSAEHPAYYMVIEGKIESGDADKFIQQINRMIDNDYLPFVRVYLNSPGGNLYDAMRIGRIIRQLEIGTIVGFDQACHSSCALILLSGRSRIVVGEIGFHRPFLTGRAEGQIPHRGEISEIYEEMENYMRAMGASGALIDIAISTPPEQMYVISKTELDRLIPFMDPASEARSVWRDARRYDLPMEEYRRKKSTINHYDELRFTGDIQNPYDENDMRLCDLIYKVDRFTSWDECREAYLWDINSTRVYRARHAEAQHQCSATREQVIDFETARKKNYRNILERGGYSPMIEVPEYPHRDALRDCYIRFMQGRVAGFGFDYLD